MRPETKLQREVVTWFRETYPEYRRCLRVSLNGLNFGSGPKAARMVNYVKSQGAELGESDLLIALKRGEFGSLVLELKADDTAHTASDIQGDYVQFHNTVGNCAVVATGFDTATAAIRQYMELS